MIRHNLAADGAATQPGADGRLTMVKAQESKLMGQYSQAKRSAFKRLKDKLS